MIQNPAIDSIEMNIKSKMWKRQAGRAVSKSQSVRKTLRKIETERSQCSSSWSVWNIGHYYVCTFIHSIYHPSVRPSVHPFVHSLVRFCHSFTQSIPFFSFQTYPSPTMKYAAQMKYKLRKELNDLQYGLQSRAVMLRLESCFVVSFLNKKALVHVCLLFQGLRGPTRCVESLLTKPVYIMT